MDGAADTQMAAFLVLLRAKASPLMATTCPSAEQQAQHSHKVPTGDPHPLNVLGISALLTQDIWLKRRGFQHC